MLGKEKEVTDSGKDLAVEAKSVLKRIDDLIKTLNADSGFLEDIKTRMVTRWAEETAGRFRLFGFQTLVEDVMGSNYVESLKKSRQRLKKDGRCSPTDIQNLQNLCDKAEEQYMKWLDCVKIQPVRQLDVTIRKKYGQKMLDDIRAFSAEWDKCHRK